MLSKTNDCSRSTGLNGCTEEKGQETQEKRDRKPRRKGTGKPGEKEQGTQEKRNRKPRRKGTGKPGEKEQGTQEKRDRKPRRKGTGNPGEKGPPPFSYNSGGGGEEGLKHSFEGSHVKRTDSDLFS